MPSARRAGGPREPSLILGPGAAATMGRLGAVLRRRTLERAREIDGHPYAAYTPWLCARPVLDHGLAGEPLCSAPYDRGDVVTDEAYLRRLSRFLDEHEALMLRELIGTREDWDLLPEIASARPGMAARLREVRGFVTGASTYFSETYEAVVEMLVPLRQRRARGWSSQYARGAVFLGFAEDYPLMDLALDLVHEMGHQALSLFQSADRIVASDWNAPVYSEVRRADRPAIQSLHAAAAIAFMARFLRDAGAEDHRHPDFAGTLAETLDKAVASLRAACDFTPVGERIMEEFAAAAHH